GESHDAPQRGLGERPFVLLRVHRVVQRRPRRDLHAHRLPPWVAAPAGAGARSSFRAVDAGPDRTVRSSTAAKTDPPTTRTALMPAVTRSPSAKAACATCNRCAPGPGGNVAATSPAPASVSRAAAAVAGRSLAVTSWSMPAR